MPVVGGESEEEPCVIASRGAAESGSSCRNDGDLEQQLDDDDDDERVSDEERATARTGSEPDGTEHAHSPSPIAGPTDDHNTDASASTGSSAENSVSFSGNSRSMIPTVLARVLEDNEDSRGPVVMMETNKNGGAANEDAPTGTSSRANTSPPVPTRTEDGRACNDTRLQIWKWLRVVLWLTFVVTVITILSTVVLANIGADDDDDDHGHSQSPSASPSHSQSPSASPSHSQSPSASPSPSQSPSASPGPSQSPSASPSHSQL